MKLTLRLLALLGYVMHTSVAVLQYEEILVHPGIIGGIFKGPNSETIIQGPDGSAITAEQIGGAVETPVAPLSAAVAETAVNSIPVSSTVGPEFQVTFSPLSIERAEISSTATPVGLPVAASARPILTSNRPVPISSSGIEVSTLTPFVVTTSSSPIQPSSQPLYGSSYFTASEPAKILLPPSSPPPPLAAPIDLYREQPVSSNQAIHLRPAPINAIVSTTAQPILISSHGDLSLSTGHASNVLGGSASTESTIRTQNELTLPSAQLNRISPDSIVQPEASIGVLQQPVTSTLPPVSLVPNTEIYQKSNIQRIPSSRPSLPVFKVAINDVRQISQPNRSSQPPSINNLSVPVTYYSPQSTVPLGVQNVDNTPSTRQNIFTAGNRYHLISPTEEPRTVSSTVTPLAKSGWVSNEPGSNQILLSAQQNFQVQSEQPGQAIIISSGGTQRLNEAQTTPRNGLIAFTTGPDTTVPSKIEPLDNQVLSSPANVPTRNIITPEIAVPKAPGLVISTPTPAIGRKQQKLELSPLPNNKGVIGTYNIGKNGLPQQILLAPLPDGAIELGATISSQSRVADRLGDVASDAVRQQNEPAQGQYKVYQSQAENVGLLSNTNPVVSFSNQNRPGPIPIDSRPLAFDTIPQDAGVVLPPRHFDDSAASVLWNRYERSSERTA